MARPAQMGKRLVARAKSADEIDAVPNEPRSIPLDLLPLLAPHKKHGRLSLRVERLPQLTRLSKGTRNNDGSWSLTRDDLEDLEYQVPDGVEGAKTLSVRIVSLAGGETLALTDYPIDADARAGAVGRSDAPSHDDEQVRMLRSELAKLKASLADRDKELASAPKVEVAVAEAETRWATELHSRLAAEAAKAALQIEHARRTWEAEQSERLAKLEARAQELATETRAEAEREARDAAVAAEAAWKTAEAARFAAAEVRWQEQAATAESALAARDAALVQANEALQRVKLDAQGALASARSDWAAAEAARLAEAEARWREKAAKAAAQDQQGDEALRALRDEVAALQTTVAARDAALVQANEALQRTKLDAQGALASAQSDWAAAEAARLAEAEARWREKAAKAAAQGQQGDEALRALRDEVAALQSTVAARDAALTQANEALERAKAAPGERDDGELLAAEARWRDEAAKARAEADGARDQVLKLTATLAAREAALVEANDAAARAELVARAAAADAQLPAAIESDPDAELRRLREKAAVLEAKLIKANKAADDERMKWQRDAQDAISRAEKDWRAKEGSRRAATEASVRKEISGALGLATSRYEAAEAALAQIRMRATGTEGRAEVELAGARTALSGREAELTRLRAENEALRNMTVTPDEAPVAAAPPDNRKLVWQLSAAAVVGVVGVVVYPLVEGLMSPPPPAPVKKAVVVEAPPPPVVVKSAVVAADLRLRAGPSTKVGVISPVDRGTAVTIIEERDEWIKVRAEGKPLREGWVKASQLKDVTSVFVPNPSASPQPATPPAP